MARSTRGAHRFEADGRKRNPRLLRPAFKVAGRAACGPAGWLVTGTPCVRVGSHDACRADAPVPAVRHADGDAGSGSRRAVEAGSILGLSAMRTPLLDYA